LWRAGSDFHPERLLDVNKFHPEQLLDVEHEVMYLIVMVFLIGSVVLLCVLFEFGACKCLFKAARDSIEAKPSAKNPANVKVLIVYGDDAGDIAERLAYTLHEEFGCRVSGAPAFSIEAVWGDTVAKLMSEGIEAVIVVLSPKLFESQTARRKLIDICTCAWNIPMVPVYAGGTFAKDDLKQLYKSKLSLKLSQEELATLEVVRRQVFAENMADVENEHHAERAKRTLRSIVQRFEAERRPNLFWSLWSRLASMACSPTAARPFYHDVFISYSTADNRQTFENLRACFVDLGCKVFNPTVDMQGAKVSLEVMQEHVRGSKVLVVMPGPGHCKSKWCRGEVMAGIEAQIPIVRVFAGQGITSSALLAMKSQDAEKLAGGEADEKVLEEVRRIRDFTFQPPLTDVRHEDHTEECVKAAKLIAFKHLPWVRRRSVMRKVLKAILFPTALIVFFLFVSANLGGQMHQCCMLRDAECLRSTVWWTQRLPLGRYMLEGHLGSMRRCLSVIEVTDQIDAIGRDIYEKKEMMIAFQRLRTIIRHNRNDKVILTLALQALQDLWTVEAALSEEHNDLFDLVIDVIRHAGPGARMNRGRGADGRGFVDAHRSVSNRQNTDSEVDDEMLIAAIRILTSVFTRDLVAWKQRRTRSRTVWNLMAEILPAFRDEWRVVAAGMSLLTDSHAMPLSMLAENSTGSGPALLETLRAISGEYVWHEGVEVDVVHTFANIVAESGELNSSQMLGTCQDVAAIVKMLPTSIGVLKYGLMFYTAVAQHTPSVQARCRAVVDCGGLDIVAKAQGIVLRHHVQLSELLAGLWRWTRPPTDPYCSDFFRDLKGLLPGIPSTRPQPSRFQRLIQRQAIANELRRLNKTKVD